MFKNKKSSIYPLGYWQCTRSIFKDFKVGEVYQCKYDSTSGFRIYPFEGSTWAPYWSINSQSFCYPKDQLNFRYLEHKVPEASKELTIDLDYQPDKVYINGVLYITGVKS